MTPDEFALSAHQLGLDLTLLQRNQFASYCHFLIEYNRHTNLTTITEPTQIYLKHFYDSLTILRVTDLADVNNLLDIGSGPGFPGMVLKIAHPNINVTLLDSNNKKIKFLNELSTKLDLSVELVNTRAEEYARSHREKFDIVTSRAVASLPILSELALPLVKQDGDFIAMKSHAVEEITASKNAIPKLGGKIAQIKEFELDGAVRTLVKIHKVRPTPTKYPRDYGAIKKRPL